MRTKTHAMQIKPAVFEYSPELVQAYVVKARQQRTEFILMSWRTLNARLRDWLTGNAAETRRQVPRVVAQSKPRPASPTESEARRAA
jgi:hypothetical protein